ncbi:MAG: polysaccharide deacetylase family protein, partial [Anaeroplasmataceae bacterium]|nr:polysaccharide deacetylase family protein [Anaeroplasmataceae bacterium]
GYENGHTKQILEALRNTDTKAIFFITGHYLNSATDLVMEMIEDGHIIGNHTYSHKDFTKSSNEEILKDIRKLENAFQEKTGHQMSKYVRPPRGEFDERSLKLLKDNGYASVFWSLAYVDWHQDTFHGNQYSYKQVMKRIHNGAILLMHTVSKDNAVDLEDIIKKLKNDGYVFKSIDSVI